MRNNVFIKSMLRQRLRTALLMLLIAASSLMFVTRAAEYIIVTGKIDTISKYYRSIGFIQRAEGSVGAIHNVYDGAEVLRGNRMIDFEDRRRSIAGIMQDTMNADIASAMKGLRRQPSFNDTFFTGKITDIRRITSNVPPHIEQVELTVRVEKVLCGYPEHVVAGQEVVLRYVLPEDELSADAWEETSLADMCIGQSYILRGAYYDFSLISVIYLGLPERGVVKDSIYEALTMRPLNEDTSTNARVVQGGPLWYIPVPHGEGDSGDMTVPYSVKAEIERLALSQSTIQLRTTADMAAVPETQKKGESVRLTAGRLLNRDDDINANPAIVLHEQLAQYRGLEIGDKLVVDVPVQQYSAGLKTVAGVENMHIEGGPSSPAYSLELTIVGLYTCPSAVTHLPALDPPQFTPYTYVTDIAYIPDSLIVRDIELSRYEPAFEYCGSPPGTEYLPEFMYSFVLNDTRDEDVFVTENRDKLAAAGYNLLFIETEAKNFWVSAEPVLQSVTIDVVVFSAVLILALSLVVFLYLRQRMKEFAISRVLGRPAKRVFGDLMLSALIFGLLSATAGGAVGWGIALRQAANTLNPFGEIASDFMVDLEPSISAYWLVALIAAVFVLFMLLALIGTARSTRRPVLEMLQGQAIEKQKENAAVSAQTSTVAQPKSQISVVAPETRKASNSAPFSAAIRFILRHIVRSPVKSVLLAVVAIFFVFALGFLRETVNSTEIEIDQLYDTTVVDAEISSENPGNFARYWGDVIRPNTVNSVLESGFAENVYIESAYHWSVIVPPDKNGGVPENWRENAGYDIDLPVWATQNSDLLIPLVGFNDIDRFISRNSGEGTADFRPEEAMDVEFADGTGPPDFVYSDGEPIPVVLSGPLLWRLSLAIGDTVYIATIHVDVSLNGPVTTSQWQFTPAVVVGTHNGNTNIQEARMVNAALLPLAGLEHIVGSDIGYTALTFTIDTARNREIDEIRETLKGIASDFRAGWGVRLNLFLNDEELRIVVGSMETNLSLLRLLYPIAIALSVAIGAGLSLLLVLQNSKNAAILRVLGTTKRRTLAVVCAEQLLVCLLGLALGLCAVMTLGWGGVAALALAGLYLAGMLVGAVVGGAIITGRPPLELLQVKE
jgi:hypothetical protein